MEKIMPKYKLTDTSYQVITYECEVEANSKDELLQSWLGWGSNELDITYKYWS